MKSWFKDNSKGLGELFLIALFIYVLLFLIGSPFACNKYEDQVLEMVNKNNKISAFDLANLISKNPIEYGLISNCIWDLVCKEKLKTNLELAKITMNSLVELNYE